MKQGEPLGGLLFALAHYQALLKTTVQAPNCVFPSLVGDTHIVGPMSEVVPSFDHLFTQLALVGFRVKMSKCKFWRFRVSLDIKIPHGYTLVIDDLCILGVLMGS
jgi:hypothetical protein